MQLNLKVDFQCKFIYVQAYPLIYLELKCLNKTVKIFKQSSQR